MKFSFKTFALMFAAVLAFASCDKPDVIDENPQKNNPLAKAFSIEVKNSQLTDKRMEFKITRNKVDFSVLNEYEIKEVDVYFVFYPEGSKVDFGHYNTVWTGDVQYYSSTEYLYFDVTPSSNYEYFLEFRSGDYVYSTEPEKISVPEAKNAITLNVTVSNPSSDWSWDDNDITLWADVVPYKYWEIFRMSKVGGSWVGRNFEPNKLLKSSGYIYAVSFAKDEEFDNRSKSWYCAVPYTYDQWDNILTVNLSGWKLEKRIKVTVRGLPRYNTLNESDGRIWGLTCSRFTTSQGFRLDGTAINVFESSYGARAQAEQKDDGSAVFYFAKGFNGVPADHSFVLDFHNAATPVTFKLTKEMTVFPGETTPLDIEFSINDFIKGSAAVSSSAGRYASDVGWVQLWDNGPKFAEFNIGSKVNNYSTSTYTAPFCGGLYPYKCTKDVLSLSSWTPEDCTPKVSDVAKSVWGSLWREPTYSEIYELYNRAVSTPDRVCDGVNVKYTDACGIQGVKVSGAKGSIYENNSIFLPAMGIKSGDGKLTGYAGMGYVFLWCSDPKLESMPCLVDGRIMVWKNAFDYYCGLSYRPVLDE